MIKVTLSSRHRIRNSSPGGLRTSTLPLCHGGSPQYWLSHVDGEETFFVSFKPPRPGTEPRTLAWMAAMLTTTLGLPSAHWARRTSWGWWDDWDDTVLQTQDSKFESWRSEAEHATSRSRRLTTILTFTRGWERNIFCFFQTAETGNRTPNSGVKGSGANHYPRPPPSCNETPSLIKNQCPSSDLYYMIILFNRCGDIAQR